MEPKYLGIVNNELTSDGSGFVVIDCDQNELGTIVQGVLSERIKQDLECELNYQKKELNQVDYSKVPDFVKRHMTISQKRNEFFLEAEGDQYKDEFGLSIECGDGFFYNIEIYDISGLPPTLKSQLASLEPNKFIYLHEMDSELERGLKKQFDPFMF